MLVHMHVRQPLRHAGRRAVDQALHALHCAPLPVARLPPARDLRAPLHRDLPGHVRVVELVRLGRSVDLHWGGSGGGRVCKVRKLDLCTKSNEGNLITMEARLGCVHLMICMDYSCKVV